MANLLAALQSILFEGKNKSAHEGCLQPKSAYQIRIWYAIESKDYTPNLNTQHFRRPVGAKGKSNI